MTGGYISFEFTFKHVFKSTIHFFINTTFWWWNNYKNCIQRRV